MKTSSALGEKAGSHSELSLFAYLSELEKIGFVRLAYYGTASHCNNGAITDSFKFFDGFQLQASQRWLTCSGQACTMAELTPEHWLTVDHVLQLLKV